MTEREQGKGGFSNVTKIPKITIVGKITKITNQGVIVTNITNH